MYGVGLAQAEGPSISQVITVVSIALSVLSLSFAFWKARALLPFRPVFDYVRLAVQVIAVLAMAGLSGVPTPVGLAAGAALLGAAMGFFQASSLEIIVDQGTVRLRRSLIGVAIWGGGLVVMQLAGLANRAGVVRLGQAIAWFSIGVTVGMIVGRRPRVNDALRSVGVSVAAAAVILAGAGAIVVGDAAPADAQATTCPAGPQGWDFQGGSGGNCTYTSLGRTAAVSASGGGKCGAELAEHWASFSGSPGAGGTVNVKNDGSDGFEKWLVLTSNSVISIAANNVDGPGIAEKFVGAANEYGRLNYPACGGSTPTTTAAGTTPPQTTAAPRTTIVTETFPDEPPPVETIVDEGAAITSTTTPPTTERQRTTTTTTRASTTVAPTSTRATPSTTIASGQTASPQLPAGDTIDRGENDVTPDEAAAQAVAGFLLAGLLGLISWAEAFQAVDAITGSTPGTAQSTYGHMQQRYPDPAQQPPPPASSGPPPPGTAPRVPSTPVSSYLPQGAGGGATGGGASGGGGQPAGGSSDRPDWLPPEQSDPGGQPAGGSSERPEWLPPEQSDPGGQPVGGSSDRPEWLPPEESAEGGDGDQTGGGGSSGETSGPSFGDWALDELEHAQLDPDGAATTVVGGAMGGPNVRISDRDGDGVFDHVEYDEDKDGVYERSGRIGPDGRMVEPAPPGVFGADGGPQTTLTDTDGDGVYDRFSQDADGDGVADTTGHLERSNDDVYLVPDGDGSGNGPGAATADTTGPADASVGPDPIGSMLDALEDGPDLGPSSAEPMEVDIGGHRTRFTDTDGDGEYDFAEGDTDGDGIFDASGRVTKGSDGEPVFVRDGEAVEAGEDVDGAAGAEADTDEEVETDQGPDVAEADVEPLTQREVEDMWRWGLERGRSLEDIREDIEGLQEARGASGPAPDPFGLVTVRTPSGEVPLTPGEAAHHGELHRELRSLHAQREAFNEQWQELLEARRRATNRELISHLRRMGAAVEVWEAESGIEAKLAAEREWIRVYKMWRAGDTWADGPDGSSFYQTDPSEYELSEAIRERMQNIDQIERERISVIETARRRGNSSDALDQLDKVQDALMEQRRQLDGRIDGVQGHIDRYESFGSGRPLPDR